MSALLGINLKCPDTPSECNLVIDDDYEENPSKKQKRIRGVRGGEEPLCLICSWNSCGKLFTVYINFMIHVEEHAEEAEVDNDLLRCQMPACDFVTKSRSMFTKHASFHAYHERLKNIGQNVVNRLSLPKCVSLDKYEVMDNVEYECRWGTCNKGATSINHFTEHIKTHFAGFTAYCSRGEYHKCQWLGCTLKFASLYKLIDHIRTHSTEKVIACPTCGHMFSSKTRFGDHRRRQMPTELHSYQCSECSKLFSTERLLRDHMRAHINNYKCTLCDMTCTRPALLASHIRFRHMDERPVKCSLCKFACVTKSHLDQHLTTHCAEKLVACEYCDYRCRSFYGLDQHHQREHLPDSTPLYECHCCKERFLRGGFLTKHLIKEHDFNWPSGHSRFRYKQESDGFYRLQTVRYESLEVTQQIISEKPPVTNDVKYEVILHSNMSGRIPSFVVELKDIPPSDSDSDDEDERIAKCDEEQE